MRIKDSNTLAEENVERFEGVRGFNGNLWDNEPTGVNTPSNVFDSLDYSHVSFFGVVSGACTLSLQVSADGINWYTSDEARYTAPQATQFHKWSTGGTRFFRAISDTNVTATLTIQCKC